MDYIAESFKIWLQILIYPFSNFNLLWRMIPIYLNGILVSIYSGRPSHTGAIFGGVVALWAGVDWLRGYASGELVASPLNKVIAFCFCAYGAISFLVGLLKRHKMYFIFGRRSILTFFAISFYPIQTGFIYNLEPRVLGAIFVVAIPLIIIFEIITSLLGKILNRGAPQSQAPMTSSVPRRRFVRPNISRRV